MIQSRASFAAYADDRGSVFFVTEQMREGEIRPPFRSFKVLPRLGGSSSLRLGGSSS